MGATGAMGTYLVPKLAERGFDVTAVAAEDFASPYPNVHCLRMDGLNPEVVKQLLSAHFDGVIDFMIYNRNRIADFAPLYLASTDHYICLSSYRVFADREHPIRESSPQIIDVSDDPVLLASDDYCIYKARAERFLRASEYRNWTIVRPAITYSKKRCQLVTLERPHILPYIRTGKELPLYGEALSVQSTMSWAGDVAEMLSRLILNEKALGEDYNITTAEHNSWGTVAEYYRELFGLRYYASDEQTYFCSINPDRGKHFPIPEWEWWQLHFDRMFTRVMDNTKILAATGLTQAELTPLYDGLLRERESLLAD